MATITNQQAIEFSDIYIRTRSDALAREYNYATSRIARWNALGGGQAATNVMGADLQAIAKFFIDNQAAYVRAEIDWNEFGQTVITAAGGTIEDTAATANDGRPIITGQNAVNLVTIWRQRVNWLGAGTASWPSTTPLTTDGPNLGTVVAAYWNPTAANLGTLINRFTEMQTQYQANSNAVLNSILAVAVNPNGQPLF